MFPNDYNVYFHDTPADALFHRVGRTFSHGCVRLENPVAMARYVLRDQPEWTDEAIAAAMHAGVEKHVKLSAPIPVHILYFTAWVDQRDGVHFARDIYGYDAKQARVPSPRSALAGRLLSPRDQAASRFVFAGFRF
jgi:murein L,D-transpeptidase YcbB/YkuD